MNRVLESWCVLKKPRVHSNTFNSDLQLVACENEEASVNSTSSAHQRTLQRVSFIQQSSAKQFLW